MSLPIEAHFNNPPPPGTGADEGEPVSPVAQDSDPPACDLVSPNPQPRPDEGWRQGPRFARTKGSSTWPADTSSSEEDKPSNEDGQGPAKRARGPA